MEFDRSKILTVVTAGQAKVGQKGWFSSNIDNLAYLVREEQPKELLGFNSNNAVHAFRTSFQNHALFYPAPEQTYAERQAEWVVKNNVKVGTKVRFTKGFKTAEDSSRCCEHRDAKGIEGVVSSIEDEFLLVRIPSDGWAVPFTALEVIKEPTYEERQAKWVKENNVKAGTKVRVTRTFTEDEDGSYCWEHDDLVGMTGSVVEYGIASHNLGITMSDGSVRAIPYFALEVIKEPTYRPFKNAEEFKPYREKWIIFHETIFQHDGYNNDGINIENELLPWEKAFDEYKFEDGTPFGIKEEV